MIFLFFISFHRTQLFIAPLPYGCFSAPGFIYLNIGQLMSRKNINLISSDYKRIWHCWKNRGRRDETLNSKEIFANSSSSLHENVIFQFIVYYYAPSPNKLKGTPNAIVQAMDVLLSRPKNTGENHIITNVKPRISANTTFTIKKTTVCTRRLFSAQIRLIYTDLTNKLRILLSVKDFANYAKFVFSWPTWGVFGFAISTKGSKPYGRESMYYHGPHILRNVVGVAI